MKKLVLGLLLATFLFIVPIVMLETEVEADQKTTYDGEITVDNIVYFYRNSDHTAAIGAVKATVSTVTIPETIVTGGQTYTVNSVGVQGWATAPSSVVKTIRLPATITQFNLGGQPLGYNVSDVIILDTNSSYSSVDGIVYDKEMKTLIYMPPGKTGYYDGPATLNAVGKNSCSYTSLSSMIFHSDVTFRSSSFNYSETEHIAIAGKATVEESAFFGAQIKSFTCNDSILREGAFYNSYKLVEVNLGDNLGEIPNDSFNNCQSLERIDFPLGLRIIGKDAFKNCTALRIISFNDNIQQINCSFPGFYIETVDGIKDGSSYISGTSVAGLFTVRTGSTFNAAKSTFNFYDGSTFLFTQEYFMNRSPSLPEYEKEGYAFVGWYTDQALTKKYVGMASSDTTLYAKTFNNTSTISFYDGNQFLFEKKFAKNIQLTLPTYEKEGYDFKGWSTSKDTNTPYSGYALNDMSLYAILEQITPTPTPDPSPDDDKTGVEIGTLELITIAMVSFIVIVIIALVVKSRKP